MTVLRLLSAGAILAICVALGMGMRRRGAGWTPRRLLERWRRGTDMLSARDDAAAGFGRARRNAYRITLALGLVLCVTGFVPVVVLGQHMTGMLLVIHVTVAPFFVIGLAAAALLWSRRHEFRGSDRDAALRAWRKRSIWIEADSRTLLKVWYWLALVVSLPLILTIIGELFPLFGTEEGEALIRVHAYSGLALTLIGILHTSFVVRLGEGKTNQALGEEKHS